MAYINGEKNEHLESSGIFAQQITQRKSELKALTNRRLVSSIKHMDLASAMHHLQQHSNKSLSTNDQTPEPQATTQETTPLNNSAASSFEAPESQTKAQENTTSLNSSTAASHTSSSQQSCIFQQQQAEPTRDEAHQIKDKATKKCCTIM
ncbi:hypothetical protein Psal073_00729 [Piscirickettsia salmonis]|uniref:hypothetical protein n=1 Tax=Piscirickettsia salmonis TaxID=1238 RepID=UPI0012B8FD89|nr:hypothetical protein [Piscirickettsia salmonis]QGO65791.1 hypothetical protein Psal073_00729 [Piscirickettsia salmonis]